MRSIEENIMWKALISIQKNALVILSAAVTLIVGGACILRMFGSNFVGFEEILIIAVFWLYMIGSSFGTYQKSQITADILEVMMPDCLVKRTIRLIRHILTFVLCCVFTYWGLMLAIWTFQMDTRTPAYRLPVVYGQLSIFVGLLISSFYNFVFLFEDFKIYIKALKNKSSANPESSPKGGDN